MTNIFYPLYDKAKEKKFGKVQESTHPTVATLAGVSLRRRASCGILKQVQDDFGWRD